ncbi:CYtochrome P450 family [Aphelenchoides fujianensis]|nr:CYtochrome P450 family [Aphelenchoides fujianensis]
MFEEEGGLDPRRRPSCSSTISGGNAVASHPARLPFPFFGNPPQLCISGRWDRQFAQWGKEFNGFYTYWFGPQPTVVIADYDLAVEILVKNSDASSTRGINDHFNDACREGTLGIVLTSGDLWKEQRSFVLKVLRQFGMGTNLMQEKILVELADIVSGLDREIAAGTEEVDVARFHGARRWFRDSGIPPLVATVSTDENRAEFEMLKRLTFGLVAQTSDPFTAAAIMNAQVAQLPIFRSRLARFVAMFHELNAFVDENIQQHLKVLDEDREPTDFIDSFLLGNEALGGQREAQLLLKVHEELDRVIGDDRIITMDDRSRLPYLNAVILESQRCGNVVVQNVLRVLTRDVHVQGRTLKKGTYICPQVSAMLWDEKVPSFHPFSSN